MKTILSIIICQVDPGFEWSPRIRPAMVPDLGTAALPDSRLTVSGWGWTGVNYKFQL